MHRGAAELLRRHRLIGDRLHHVRPGNEHVARVFHHEDEVGHRRRIDIASGAGPHDDRDLRDDARREHVALKHLGVAGERGDALLDARAAGVVEPDDRRAVAERHVLHFLDFFRVRFGQRAAEDGKVLGEDEGRAAVDRAPAGDHAVAGNLSLRHAEFGAAVLDEHVELLERPFVEQHVEPLARRELAALVLLGDALGPAALARLLPPLFQLVQNLAHPDGPRPSCSSKPTRVIARVVTHR